MKFNYQLPITNNQLLKRLSRPSKSLSPKPGNAWIGIILLMTFLLTLGLALVSDSVVTITQTKKATQVMVAQALGDAGIEKALWKLNDTNGGYMGETDIDMGTGTLDIEVTNIDSENKVIIATAYVPNKTDSKTTRTVRAQVSALPDNQNISFRYAIQGGTDGIAVSGSSEIEGNLYSNGNITFSGGSYHVEGDAAAHGVVTPNPNSRVHGNISTGVPIIELPTVSYGYWEDLATQGGTIVGNYSPSNGTTIGAKKITGNLTLGSSTAITLAGPLYVEGNLTMAGSSSISLSSSLGESGTVIIVEGTVSISGSAHVHSHHHDHTYLLIASTSTSSTAISYNGSAESEALALHAANGGVYLGGSGEIVALAGKYLNISGSGEIEYRHGLANANFSAGPGGSWQVTEWQIIH